MTPMQTNPMQIKPMKDEPFYGLPLPGSFPEDFARRVIAQARAEQHRQRVRRRYALAAAMLVIVAIPLATLLGPKRDQLASRDSSTSAPFNDSTADEQLTQAMAPDQPSDYLVPNTAPLRAFTASYSDASWNYDPSWTSYR